MFLYCAYILAIPFTFHNDSIVCRIHQIVSYSHIAKKGDSFMKPDSTSYENILEVENWGSQLSTFYKIMSPVQITLESCTGLGETD